MKNHYYSVPLIQQGLQECAQASAAQLLNFYGVKKSIDEVIQEVPVYIDAKGQPLGTSIGHIAKYFIDQGFKTTLYTADVQIFDRSWENASAKELIELLEQRKRYLKHPVYTSEVIEVIVAGYIAFIKAGGEIQFPLVSKEYIVSLLKKGPIYAVVNYNLLNSVAKYRYVKEENRAVKDAVKGNPTTHAIVTSGYRDNKFCIVDPDFEYGGEKWIDSDQLLAAWYLAEVDYDNVLITLGR